MLIALVCAAVLHAYAAHCWRDGRRIEARMVAEDEMLEHVEARHAPNPAPDLEARRREGIRRAQLHEAAVRRGKQSRRSR